MYKKEHYQKIVNFIKEKPLSQKEIYKLLNPELSSYEISLQGIAKDIKRAVKNGSITYLGNKVNKKDARFLLKKHYKIKWSENAHQCYIYTPETKRFYKHLKAKTTKDLSKALQIYSALEIKATFQKVYFEDLNTLRTDFKSRGENLTDKELKKKIIRKRKEIKDFYNTRNKKNPLLKLLKLSPSMYWSAFKTNPLVPEDSSKYLDTINQLIEELNFLLIGGQIYNLEGV